MAKEAKNAITPTRQQDYPEWYQQVIRAADLAENSSVRGCMVIKPWGYGVWERIQQELDRRIKDSGHENAYFPLFIPLSFMEREAAHVEGFAKECAVVTHYRLEARDGNLVPAGELEEPLVVRPTSETIIGDSFSRWIQSYRDLPLLINQWANIVRWEMRTRLFLRTTEFLWQEGHTAHASAVEAQEETLRMLQVYQELAEDILALPVVVGEKTAGERFPGAVQTFSIEAMMQDRKALQAGTSHYLGQNFAKTFDIKFLNQEGVQEYAYTTSWGVSTRLIGGVIMCHSDDDGLRLPPRIAPKHLVVLPVITSDQTRSQVLEYADQVKAGLDNLQYHGNRLISFVDQRDLRGGEKSWQWIKKGIPVRVEVGPREIEQGQVVVYRRDRPHKEKLIIKKEELVGQLIRLLDQIQESYYQEALCYRDEQTVTGIDDFEQLKSFFTPKNQEKPEIHGGFVLAKWCNDPLVEKELAETKITIRCLPLEQSGSSGKCVITGRPATTDAIFAKAY